MKLNDSDIARIADAIIQRLNSANHAKPRFRSYAWDEVDWTQRNVDIAAQLGAAEQYVSVMRRRLGKPKVTKASLLNWDAVDWNLPNGEIAAQLGISAVTVRHWRMKLKKPKSKPMAVRWRITQQMIRAIDWKSEQDQAIAYKWKCSRERVRQIRQEKGLPQCDFKWHDLRRREFVAWAHANKADLDTMGIRKFLEQSPTNASNISKIRWLGQEGIFYEHPNNRLHYPSVNWDLPNVILDWVYHPATKHFGHKRSRRKFPSPKWDFRFGRGTPTVEFQKAVSDEIRKSEAAGFKPQTHKIWDWCVKLGKPA